MPRKAADYSKAIQYKIVCKNPAITDCYNGSCISFKDRKKKHKHCCNNPNAYGHNLKVYQFIREHGGWANWEMIQIEESPCKSKQELLTREREIFNTIKPTLNMISPTFNVEKMKMKSDEYRATHMEEIKKWRDDHKEEQQEYAVQYNATHKEERKKWREDHKEKLKEYFEEYYEQNKVEIAARRKEQITCECGCVSTKHDLSRHQRTQKHLAIMAQKQ